uniref:von Willebrand factor D and EGF domain-containing protein n=1 Tax=Lygus hesperus TaxID=30085 RepID=A0A0A9XVK2_LYGHE
MNNLVLLGTVIISLNIASAEEYGIKPIEIESGNKRCAHGYEYLSDKDTCIPMCGTPCYYGECSKPGICSCLTGFHKLHGDVNQTVCEPDNPICKINCMTSQCISNESCQCLSSAAMKWFSSDSSECGCSEGYEKTIEGNKPTCSPICNPPCVNGECIKHNECRCLPGFSNQTSKHVCEPFCQFSCINSTCVKDGQCECLAGFSKDKLDPFKCKPSCSRCDQDLCVAPNVCRCPTGFSEQELQLKANNILEEEKDWSNVTFMRLSWCVEQRSNYTNQPHKPTIKDALESFLKTAGLPPGFMIIVVLLLVTSVLGIIAISVLCTRNRSITHKVSNDGRIKRVTSENEEGRIELEDASTDFSVRYLHNEIGNEVNRDQHCYE